MCYISRTVNRYRAQFNFLGLTQRFFYTAGLNRFRMKGHESAPSVDGTAASAGGKKTRDEPQQMEKSKGIPSTCTNVICRQTR